MTSSILPGLLVGQKEGKPLGAAASIITGPWRSHRQGVDCGHRWTAKQFGDDKPEIKKKKNCHSYRGWGQTTGGGKEQAGPVSVAGLP